LREKLTYTEAQTMPFADLIECNFRILKNDLLEKEQYELEKKKSEGNKWQQ